MTHFRIDDKTFRRIKLPLLVQNEDWLKELESFKNDLIIEMVKECRAKIELELQLTQELRKHQKEKKALMEKILEWADEVNQKDDRKAEKKLDQARNSVLIINEKMDELAFQLELLPKEIQKLNEALFHETIDAVYQYIASGNERLEGLNETIPVLRKQLGALYEEKFDIENRVESVYKYLHKTLGKNETDDLDMLFLGRKKDGNAS